MLGFRRLAAQRQIERRGVDVAVHSRLRATDDCLLKALLGIQEREITDRAQTCLLYTSSGVLALRRSGRRRARATLKP